VQTHAERMLASPPRMPRRRSPRRLRTEVRAACRSRAWQHLFHDGSY